MKQDWHVHLHGCLTPEQLWSIGKDVYKKNDFLLSWYANEYEKAWGRQPNYKDYWENENGFEQLKKDYLFLEPNNFDRFQANFNLIIALCPLKTDDFSIQEMLIRKKVDEGFDYFEARTVFSPRFQKAHAFEYLKGLCQKIQELNSELTLETKLVFSLPRDESLLTRSYSWIKDFQEAEPILGKEIVGIDLACSEEGYPPEEKSHFSKLLLEDNKSGPPLKLLYHVGESFRDKTLWSAIRWVVEAHRLGADRLGHGIALGVDPTLYLGKRVFESQDEIERTSAWLDLNREKLEAYGFSTSSSFSCFSKNSQQGFLYSSESVGELRVFQNACQRLLKDEGVVLESCPTSNMLIGEMPSFAYHPLRSFIKNGMDVVLGTDDPGIFSTSFEKEKKIFDSMLANSEKLEKEIGDFAKGVVNS